MFVCVFVEFRTLLQLFYHYHKFLLAATLFTVKFADALSIALSAWVPFRIQLQISAVTFVSLLAKGALHTVIVNINFYAKSLKNIFQKTNANTRDAINRIITHACFNQLKR